MKISNENYKEITNDKEVVDDTVEKLLENILEEHKKIFGKSNDNSE